MRRPDAGRRLIGTVGYMAPEQLEGGEVTAQTDVYALAATFYECLTGRIPFQRELAEGCIRRVGELEPVSRVRPVCRRRSTARSPRRCRATRRPLSDLREFLDACRAATGLPPPRQAASPRPTPAESRLNRGVTATGARRVAVQRR